MKKHLIKWDYAIKNGILKILRNLLFKRSLEDIHRIVVFRTGSLGDSICSLPALATLRHQYPNATVEILTESGGKSLIGLDKLIAPSVVDGFLFYKGIPFLKLIKQLRQKRTDLFVLLPQAHAPFKSTLRNLIFAKLIGAKRAIGFKIGVTRLFPQTQAKMALEAEERRQKGPLATKYNLLSDTSQNLEPETINTPPANNNQQEANSFYPTIPNVRDFFMSLLSKEGITPLRPYQYPFDIKPADIDTVTQLANHHYLTDTTKNIAFVVGAKRPQNRWPIGYFNLVVQHFINKGYSAVLIGGPEDTELAKQMDCYCNTVDLTGKLTPIQSGLMFKKCALVVSNDTGPLHLAYAFGSKVVALFSSRDYPLLWYPPHEQSYVFRNNHIACSECFTETCINNLCMQAISPVDVIAKTEEMLG